MSGSLVVKVALLGAAVVAAKFDVYDHLGNLSPYTDAPVLGGLTSDLPASCTVDQLMLMQRHGSRYPLGSELTPFITGLVSKLSNASAILSSEKAVHGLPKELQFLTKGYTTSLGVNDLTAPGRKQLFDAGVNMRLKYESLVAKSLPITLLVGAQDRVIESAQWFQSGFFGRFANVTSVFTTIAEDSVTPSWITPMNTCKKWDYNYGNNLTVSWGTHYLPPIVSRLNTLLAHSLGSKKALVLNEQDVHGALYACAYDYANTQQSPWCAVFEDDEIDAFEYELDLLMWGAFGYGLPGSMPAVLGAQYVRQLVSRLSNATGSAVPMYLEFGHDTTIDLALTGLGLIKDEHGLSTSKLDKGRKWRTTEQVPFAAHMVWEKFSCSSSTSGFTAKTPYIRLLLNAAPFSLSPLCSSSSVTKKYGACKLADFVKAPAVKKATNDATGKWGGALWNATCGA